MMKKGLILLVLLLAIAFMPLSEAQPVWIIGLVKDAIDCTDPAWRAVHLYYTDDRNNYVPCSVDPQTNYFFCDSGNIPEHGSPRPGDNLSAELPDLGDGYYAGPVSMIWRGERIMPTMTLTSDFLGLASSGSCADTDNDWINDVSDNCPLLYNPGGEVCDFRQCDSDGDGYGDVVPNGESCDPEPFNPQIPEAHCGGTITQDTTLGVSLFCRNGDGLAIGAKDITLNCNGFRLNGNGLNTGVILNGVTNVQIKNCQVRNFATGIRATKSNDNTIFNNFFNNIMNAMDDGVNFWNIAKTVGPNIIRGPFIGGNFWRDYFGDDLGGDKIGDTEIRHDSQGNIQSGGDMYPLVLTSSQHTVLPESFNLFRGFFSSGTLQDFFENDDSHFVSRAGLTLFLGEPPLQLVLTGIAPSGILEKIRFILQASMNTPGVNQTIELWDYTNNRWQQFDSRMATTSDSVVEFNVEENLENFVESGTGEMKAKISFKQVGLTLVWPWTARIDQAVWEVSSIGKGKPDYSGDGKKSPIGKNKRNKISGKIKTAK